MSARALWPLSSLGLSWVANTAPCPASWVFVSVDLFLFLNRVDLRALVWDLLKASKLTIFGTFYLLNTVFVYLWDFGDPYIIVLYMIERSAPVAKTSPRFEENYTYSGWIKLRSVVIKSSSVTRAYYLTYREDISFGFNSFSFWARETRVK